MKSINFYKTTLFVASIGGATIAVIERGSVIALAAVLIALIATFQLAFSYDCESNSKALKGALKGVKAIINGEYYLGDESEIIATGQLDQSNTCGLVQYELICRTKKGNWFLFEVGVNAGVLYNQNLRACDEETARNHLQLHHDAYVRWFGKPLVA